MHAVSLALVPDVVPGPEGALVSEQDPTTGLPEGGPACRVDGYAPIEGYAALGDGRTIALVARDGSIDWLPFPTLDTPPAFSALLDTDRGGSITLRPRGGFTTGRRYVPGTNVLETVFRCEQGVVRVTDALVQGLAGQLPWTELARRIEGLEGEVEMEWTVEPGTLFGGGDVERFATGSGPLLRAGDVDLVVVGRDHGRSDPVENTCGRSEDPPVFHGTFTTSEGSSHVLGVVGVRDEPVHVPDPDVVEARLERTIDAWQTWSEEFEWEGPWQEHVHRSALALKLLISPSGAIAAAGTVGLPESDVEPKNYDYRFAWVRDLSYTVGSMLRFGLREEPHAGVSWILRALKRHGGDLRIFFTLEGGLSDGVTHLEAQGWRGRGPVLDGNEAAGQLQLGCYADLFGILTEYVRGGHQLDRRTGEMLTRYAEEVCERWTEPDSGMWELPQVRHHVSSKMGCWQALDCALALVEWGELEADEDMVSHWREQRQAIVDWVDAHGWDEERGCYRMHDEGDDLDASVLLHARSGFDRGERMSRTIDVLRRELGAAPTSLLYRYTGMREVEGTFTACAFWVASALACVGRHEEAVELMDDLVTHVNDVGLLSEMIDPQDGSFLGNMPQGLSHIALLNAAITIDELDPDRPDTDGPRTPHDLRSPGIESPQS